MTMTIWMWWVFCVCVELTLITIGLECCVPIKWFGRDKSQRIWHFCYFILCNSCVGKKQKFSSFLFFSLLISSEFREINQRQLDESGAECGIYIYIYIKCLSGNDLYLLTVESVCVNCLSHKMLREIQKSYCWCLVSHTVPACVAGDGHNIQSK